MELAPVPTRPSLMGRLWLVVALAALAPLVLLVVVPTMLGLQRYVVTSDALGDSVPRGSLTFAERVPGDDLRPGDVITFHPPSRSAGAALVTRRVVSANDTGIRTEGDLTGTDPWLLSPDIDRSRVIWHIPYLGYPFSGGVRPTIWVMLASVPLVAVLLAVIADLDRARHRRRVTRRQEQLHVTDV
jgi:signal peptidase I